MSDVDLELLAVTLTADDDGEPAPNIGDTADGKGVGAGVACFAPIGFYGGPLAPSGNGASCKAVVATLGDHRVIIAASDGRRAKQLATPLASADRAILSSCAARFELRAAADTVGLYGDDMSVILDSANGAIALTKGPAQVTITDTAITLQLGPLVLSLNGAMVSIATQSGPPASLSVNGIPVIVP